MPGPRLRSLRPRLLVLVTMAVLPTLVLMLLFGIERRQRVMNQALEQSLGLAQAAGLSQELALSDVGALLLSFSHLDFVRDRDAQGCDEYFARVASHFPQLRVLVAVSPTGDIFCTGSPRTQFNNVGSASTFLRAVQEQGLVAGGYQLNPVGGRPVLPLGLAVRDDAGQLLAVLIAPLDLSWLAREAGQTSLPPGSEFLVVDRDGVVLARGADSGAWQGKRLAPDSSLLAALGQDAVTRQVAGEDGVVRLYGIAPVLVDGSPVMYVAVGVEPGAALADADAEQRRNLSGVALAAGLTLLAVLWGSETLILRDVRALVVATRRLTAGDLSARSALPHGGAEVGQLGAAFDQMAGSLEEQERQRRAADQAQRASENRFRDVAEVLADVIIETDTLGIITYCSESAPEVLGRAVDSLVGQPLFATIVPEEVPAQGDLPATRYLCGTPFRDVAATCAHSNGRILHFHLSGVPITDEQGGRTGYRCVAKDVTERATAQRELRVTADILHLLSSDLGRSDLHELMAAVIGFLREWTGCEAVGIRLRQGEDYPYFETSGFPASFVNMENHLCAVTPDGQTLRDGSECVVLECMCGAVIRERFNPEAPFFTPVGTFWTNSTSELLAQNTEANMLGRTRNRCNAEGYESVALIPLRVGLQSLGLIQLNDHRPGRFTSQTIALLERLAGNVAMALARRQAEDALAEASELMASILAATPVLVAYLDRRFNYVFVNQSFAEAEGQSPAFFPGKNHFALYPSDEEQAIFRRVLADGILYFAAGRRFGAARHKGRGATCWDWSLAPVKDPAGVVAGLVYSLVDVTERHRAETTREVMAAVSQLMVSSGSLEAVFDALPKLLADHLEFPLAVVELYDEANGRMVVAGSAGLSDATVAGHALPAAGTVSGRVALTRQPMVQEDAGERSPSEYGVLGSAGVGSLVCVPVAGPQRVLGALSLADTARRGDVSHFVSSLQVIANHLAQEMERRGAQERLSLSEDTARAVLNATTDAAFLLDTSGAILFGNTAMADRLGKTPGELAGLSMYEISSLPGGDILEQHAAAIQEVVSSGQPVRFEEERDGRWLDTSVYPVFGADGAVVRLAVFSRDTTEAKLRELDLRRWADVFRFANWGIAVGDSGGPVVGAVNPAFARMHGYSVEEMAGIPVSDLYPADRAGEVEQQRQAARRSGQGIVETVRRRKDGTTFPALINRSFAQDGHGKNLYHVTSVQDITELKRVESALRDSQERYRSLFEYSSIPIWEEDFSEVKALFDNLRQQGVKDWRAHFDAHPEDVARCASLVKVVDINQESLHLFQVKSKTELSRRLSDYFAADSLEVFREEMIALAEGGRHFNSEIPVRMPDGTRRLLDLRLSVVSGHEEMLSRVMVSIVDITERRRAEDALRESHQRYAGLFANSPVPTWEEDFSAVRTRLDELGGQGVVDFAAYFREHLDDLHACADLVKVLAVNQASLQSLGRASMTDIPLRLSDYFVGSTWDVFADELSALAGGKTHFESDMVTRAPDGSESLAALRLSVMPGCETSLERVLVSTMDLTERKRAEEQIQAALREKEVLLREIHHRVKNNLQVVASLLTLQSHTIQDPQVLEVFRESQNRVRAMAMIHAKLYQSKDLARIDIPAFVHDLSAMLFSSYRLRAPGIGLEVEADDILLNIDDVIPCGLIITELVTNALKHAFPGGRGGCIQIRLTSEGENIVLSVGDDGVGFPAGADFRQTETLGLQLVQMLAEQLGGQLELHQEGGTEFILTFRQRAGEPRW